MAVKTWNEGPKTTVVCVDSWAEGVPSGRLYTPQAPQGRRFHSLIQFLQEMEALLDSMELPTAFAGLRSFAPRQEKPPDPPPPGGRTGKVATFALRVLFRQNVSWQGSVTWLEGKQEQSFRSVLELVLMISDALQYQE